MYRLEHGVGDKRKAEDATPRIEQIKVNGLQYVHVELNPQKHLITHGCNYT